MLASISQLLVISGYGFHRATKMMKKAYVEAARVLEGGSKKPSIAGIAAATGLTRIEVSRLLRLAARGSYEFSKPQNRAAQVALGWVSDDRYNGSQRGIRQLPFDGKRNSFSALAKTYSGDIPARAMLTEMKRLGMAREEKNGLVRLLRTEGRIPKTAVSAMRAISPWVSQLSQFGQTPRNSELSSSTNHLSLRFNSIPQVLAAIRLLEERRSAFLDALSELGGHPPRDSKYSIEVTVAVAAAKPSKITTQPPRRGRKGR